LQRRAERDYFQKAIGLPAGEVYVSPIELTRGNPEAKTPRVPVLRVATPVYMPDGHPFGVLSISVDMRAVLARIRSASLGGAQVFVLNAQGDYLVHPNPAKAFGFEFGKAAHVHDEFPQFAQIAEQACAAFRRLLDEMQFGVRP